MRTMMFLLLAGAVFLSGCASMNPGYQSDIDFNKVARIEAAARAVGVQVYWVNYPTKPSTTANQ